MVLTEVVDLQREPLDRLRGDWLISTESGAKSTKESNDLLKMVKGSVQYQKGWSVVNATVTSQVRKANHLLL